jgi:hypothetical protein
MKHKILGIAKKILGETRVGAVDYYRFPERRMAWGGPFNGQVGRRAIFEVILSTAAPALILETGTFLGTTTELMAKTRIAVVSVEGNARSYGFARMRLRRFPNVELRLGDSRIELRRALNLRGCARELQPVFAYLDAHWNEDLPLAEELESVFSAYPNAVVMIDDFQVPDDSGYGYDDYGPGKALDRTYIAGARARHALAALYPSLRSFQETGARRGCVVLANEAMWKEPLLATGLLREIEV